MNKKIILITIFAAFFNCQIANSQVIDSMYYGWVVYEYQKDPQDDSTKKCYIIATPHKSDSSYSASRNPYLSITRYAKNRSEEVSIYSGYEYKISSAVHLLIDAAQKQLYTQGSGAWARTSLEDKEIISMMLKSQYVKARSDSSTGNYAIDEYEMKGLTRAYSRMKELCS